MLFGRKKQKLPALYTDAERAALEAHITKYFGKIDTVIRDGDSPDISVDIAVISPTSERNFFTLVTIGMGAYRMGTPSKASKYGISLDYAELIICLPPNWNMQSILAGAIHDEQWYWPTKLLKDTARIPLNDSILIDQGSFFSAKRPYANNTNLCGVLATAPECDFDYNPDEDKYSDVCVMPSGKEVNLYQLVPLYRNEIEFLNKYTDTVNDEETRFFDYLYSRGAFENSGLSMIVDINRKSIIDYIDK